jgi:hypothetical protein
MGYVKGVVGLCRETTKQWCVQIPCHPQTPTPLPLAADSSQLLCDNFGNIHSHRPLLSSMTEGSCNFPLLCHGEEYICYSLRHTEIPSQLFV